MGKKNAQIARHIMYKPSNLFLGKPKPHCNVEALKAFLPHPNKGPSEITIANVHTTSNAHKAFFLVIIFFIDFTTAKYLSMEIAVCVNIVLQNNTELQKALI